MKLNRLYFFSLIVDETTDINGIEPKSMCVRYIKDKNEHEELAGFILLQKFDAKLIFKIILKPYCNMDLDINQCAG